MPFFRLSIMSKTHINKKRKGERAMRFFDVAAVCEDDDAGSAGGEDSDAHSDRYDADLCDDEEVDACSPSFYRRVDAIDDASVASVELGDGALPSVGASSDVSDVCSVDDALLVEAVERVEVLAAEEDAADDAFVSAAVDDFEFVAVDGGGSRPLDGRQLLALSHASDGHNFLLLGSAGTGKSTVVHEIVRLLTSAYIYAARKGESSARIVAVVAPTGRAAANVGGSTIHSFFRWTPEYRDGELLNPNGWMAAASDPRFAFLMSRLGTIIIDEISMLPASHFDGISAMMQFIRGDPRPFGGIQVIGVGDFFQLPPVAAFGASHPTHPGRSQYVFFSSEFVRSFAEVVDSSMDRFESTNRISIHCLRHIQLEVSYRQENDPAFFRLLENMRSGMMTPADFAALEDVTFDVDRRAGQPGDEKYLRLFARKIPADRYNARHLEESEMPHVVCQGYIYAAQLSEKNAVEYVAPGFSSPGLPGPSDEYGVCPSVGSISERFRVSSELEFAIGSRVLVVANQSVSGGVYNGAMGTVVGVLFPSGLWTGEGDAAMPPLPAYSFSDPLAVGITVLMDTGTLAVVYRYLFRFSAHTPGSRLIYVFPQFPLVLGYAMTVHKCQGITLHDGVCIDPAHMMDTPGHLYVAISRCKSFANLRIITPHLNITQDKLVSRDVLLFYSS